MFKKLIKWFGLDKPTNTLEDFLRTVQRRADTNSCETFATFTPQGFNLVIELLINKAVEEGKDIFNEILFSSTL